MLDQTDGQVNCTPKSLAKHGRGLIEVLVLTKVKAKRIFGSRGAGAGMDVAGAVRDGNVAASEQPRDRRGLRMCNPASLLDCMLLNCRPKVATKEKGGETP